MGSSKRQSTVLGMTLTREAVKKRRALKPCHLRVHDVSGGKIAVQRLAKVHRCVTYIGDTQRDS